MRVRWYIDFSKNLDDWDFCKKEKILPMKVQIRKRKKERRKELKSWSFSNYESKKDRKKTLKELLNFPCFK